MPAPAPAPAEAPKGPSPLALWSKKNEAELAKRADQETNERNNVREEAEAERALFTKERNKKIEAAKAAHRAAQRAQEGGAQEGEKGVWERAVALIESDAKPKADLTKFKALLLKLKHTPVAPPMSAA